MIYRYTITHISISIYLILLVVITNSYGFSLGDIKVKNKFGELFDAEIAVETDGRDGLKAVLGTEREYSLLGLTRNSIVDKLSIKTSPLDDGQHRYLISIKSEEPLFYPSFNLVIKADLGGDSIIEKYFLSVDFKQAVSIGGMEEKDKDEEKKVAEEIALEVGEDKTRRDNFADGAMGFEHERLPIESGNTESHRVETIERERTEEIKALVDNRGPKYYGPIRVGETLFEIVKKIGYGIDRLNSGVVALWKLNKDAFLQSNIHGLKSNSTLDYSKLDTTIDSINETEAKDIIMSQWHVWLNTTRQDKQYPIPYDNIVKRDEFLYDTLLKWKDSWVKEDIDNQMGYYSKDYSFQGNNWSFLKIKRGGFNAIHDSINLDIDNINIIRLSMDDVKVSFRQRFTSEQMKSIGIKTLRLKFVDNRWQIVEEGWQSLVDKDKPKPEKGYLYALHVASFKNINDAVYEVNRWRKKGFSAYFVKDNIEAKGGEWYRIFIERVATYTDAKELSNFIKQERLSNYVLEMKVPYYVEVLKKEEGDTVSLLSKLVDMDMSPFLLTEYNPERGFDHKVIVGGYANKAKADMLSAKLEKGGFLTRVVTP